MAEAVPKTCVDCGVVIGPTSKRCVRCCSVWFGSDEWRAKLAEGKHQRNIPAIQLTASEIRAMRAEDAKLLYWYELGKIARLVPHPKLAFVSFSDLEETPLFR